jgi:hypothetical protein
MPFDTSLRLSINVDMRSRQHREHDSIEQSFVDSTIANAMNRCLFDDMCRMVIVDAVTFIAAYCC